MSNIPRLGAPVLRQRYINRNMQELPDLGTTYGLAGRVYLSLLEVTHPVVVDKILVHGNDPTTGNIRAGIYHDNGTLVKPDLQSLIVESAAVAKALTYQLTELTIADTILVAGFYWTAVQCSVGTDGLIVPFQQPEGVRTYDRVGGFGAFTNPCPATVAATFAPYVFVRVKTNLPL